MIDTTQHSSQLCSPNDTPSLVGDSLCNIDTVNNPNCKQSEAQSALSLEFLAQHIAIAHETGLWTWEHVHDDRWKNLFYSHLIRHSQTATPLTLTEAKAYEAQLSTSLPKQGFFPEPHIMYKNLALIRKHARVHHPLPTRLQGASKLCVPTENYATAACDLAGSTFIGFYMGWVVSPSSPASPHHTLQLRSSHDSCNISGWDTALVPAVRHKIFPLSHINEYLWETDHNPNGNNLRSTNFGSLLVRASTRCGTELTLGHGRYDYDWSHYKRVLLTQALARVQLICELQAHDAFASQLQELRANLISLSDAQYKSISTLTGPLHTLWEIVEGTNNIPLHGTLLIHDMSFNSFLHQLGGVQEFVDSSVFRHAHHPDRRQPTYFKSDVACGCELWKLSTFIQPFNLQLSWMPLRGPDRILSTLV